MPHDFARSSRLDRDRKGKKEAATMKKLTLMAALVGVMIGMAGWSGGGAAADGQQDCYNYTVACSHVVSQVACTHLVQVSVACCCHSSRWHYVWRAAHVADLVLAHPYDVVWSCTCGDHR
jgi:hypothetical protein